MSENLATMAGKSNTPDIWEFVVGERIDGAFQDMEGNVVLVMRSGVALVLTSLGGHVAPAYWVESRTSWEPRLNRVRGELLRVQGGLRKLLFAGLDLDERREQQCSTCHETTSDYRVTVDDRVECRSCQETA